MSITRPQTHSFADTIEVTRETLRRATRGLPSVLRLALGYPLGIRYGTLTMRLPDGRKLLFRGKEPGPSAEMVVNDLAFARRLILDGDLGFAEAFIRREWDTPDLSGFLHFFAVNMHAVRNLTRFNPLARLLHRYRHWRNRNTRTQAKRNIAAHYDLGNAFYRAWLDPSMTYSSALFETGAETLHEAQLAKYRRLARELTLKPGDHVLEIGCGWGGFAEVAVREFGAKVTGLTLSQEQFDFATRRMAEAGLADRVTIKLQDYRDEQGRYDAVASIEMLEAVGKEYWQTYFDTVAACLAPGGRAGIQAITIDEAYFSDYIREIDFIRAYIFPGGMLPTPTHMRDLPRNSGLVVENDMGFGQDYARTLHAWADRFTESWNNLAPLGFDERFRRMWLYYLFYCEAGFRTGGIDFRQIVFRCA